jgi:hypothetical protein
MSNFTIANEYTLPSEGLVYSTKINPTFKLRSMTTVEEMKRLNHSDKPNKNLAEIIDDCLVENIGISAYDMCLPDFQYVLHKLRIVTYGPSYKLSSNCPWCGSTNINTVNLDELNLVEFDYDKFLKYSEFDLPSTGHTIKLRMQTPRILDSIALKVKDIRKKNPNFEGDPAFLFTLEALIDTVDGRPLERFRITEFIRKLPMMDSNYLLKCAEKLNEMFGLDKSLEHTCSVCGLDYTGNFRTTNEFFRPSID